jgi:hypothetical protein
VVRVKERRIDLWCGAQIREHAPIERRIKQVLPTIKLSNEMQQKQKQIEAKLQAVTNRFARRTRPLIASPHLMFVM